MELRCPGCGTVYDAAGYPTGHRFACRCGAELAVPPLAPGEVPPVRRDDPGLTGQVKALLFCGNLCAWPALWVVSLIAWLLVRDERPRTASDICTYTWIPFVLSIVLAGLYVVLVLALGLVEELQP